MSDPKLTPAMRAALLVAARSRRGASVGDKLWLVGSDQWRPIGKPLSAPALLACERRGFLRRERGEWTVSGARPDRYHLTAAGLDALRAEVST